MTVFRIEVCGSQNECLLFSPTRTKLRGRWDQSRVSHRDKSEAMKMLALAVPSIPGMAIEVDTESGRGRIFDLLKEPANSGILEKMNGVFREYQSEFGSAKEIQPETIQSLSRDDMKTWLFVMSQAVAAGMAINCAGFEPVPSDEAIRKLPGKRRRDPMNTGPQTAKNPNDGDKLYAYADEVSTGGKVPA